MFDNLFSPARESADDERDKRSVDIRSKRERAVCIIDLNYRSIGESDAVSANVHGTFVIIDEFTRIVLAHSSKREREERGPNNGYPAAFLRATTGMQRARLTINSGAS